MQKLMITAAACALLAGPAFAGGNHKPTPPAPTPTPTPAATSSSSSSAGAAALGVGVGYGEGGNASANSGSYSQGGDAKAYGGAGGDGGDASILGSGNSSSSSGVYGSGNSSVKTSQDQGQLQGQLQGQSIGDTSSSSISSLANSGNATQQQSIGDTSASSSSDNANNASQSVNVDASTHMPKPAVASAIAPVVVNVAPCTVGGGLGFQTRDFGASIGGGKANVLCDMRANATVLASLGHADAGIRLMCQDKMIRATSPELCGRPESYEPKVVTVIEYRDKIVYRDAPAMAPIPNPPEPKKAAPRKRAKVTSQRSLEDYCEEAAKVCKAVNF